MPDNHVLSISDEYAFPNGPTLRPQFRRTVHGRLGFVRIGYV